MTNIEININKISLNLNEREEKVRQGTSNTEERALGIFHSQECFSHS
jgi:hypothetical protein